MLCVREIKSNGLKTVSESSREATLAPLDVSSKFTARQRDDAIKLARLFLSLFCAVPSELV